MLKGRKWRFAGMHEVDDCEAGVFLIYCFPAQ